jgi:hypothetical protein
MGRVLAWLPVTQLIAGFYGANPGFCHMILDTAFSLAAAIFSFILLPAGDFLIGQEPPEAVRIPCPFLTLDAQPLLQGLYITCVWCLAVLECARW